jgi:hypothetical protein
MLPVGVVRLEHSIRIIGIWEEEEEILILVLDDRIAWASLRPIP